MPVVRLKGLNKATKILAGGRRVTYWYAWRGGPLLAGEPGSPEFMAAYTAAIAARAAPPAPGETLAGLVTRYRASPEWAKLAASTKAHWLRWLDRIGATGGPKDIGDLSLRLLEDRRAKADILDWRDQWAASPRQADYAMQVLGRVLSWATKRGLLAVNLAADTEHLYEQNRADQVWSDADIAAFIAHAPNPEVGFVLRLACCTGLRREDLTRLSWKHVGRTAILIPAGKSRRGKIQRIPLLKATRQLLDEIAARQRARHVHLVNRARIRRAPPPPEALTVLTTFKTGRPWTPSGLEHMVIDVKAAAGLADKHLHDAKGTFGTYLRKRGLKASEIADVLGWEEKRVEALLSTYVDNDAIVQDIIDRLDRTEREDR